MGFLSGLAGTVTKTLILPVAIVDDAVNVVTGQDVDTTRILVEDTVDDLSDAINDLCDGEM